MKIGVLACLYGNSDLLPRVMQPWIELKNEGVDIVISAVHTQFKQYAELGYADEDSQTVAALEENRAVFDALHMSDVPLTEEQARNIALVPLTHHEVDVVWMLDGDELYTKENIKGIIDFVEKTPRFDYYHIPLDNRIFSNIRWADDMAPPRIFRTNRRGGIGGFVWDNEIMFADGVLASDILPGMIPKKIAHVEHRTWQREGLEKKIAYHRKHFGLCPFYIDSAGNPAFDPSYFTRYQMPIPVLKENSTVKPKKPLLEVLFRSHTTNNFRPTTSRVTDTLGGKSELTVRCLRSLIHALIRLERANIVEIRLTIVDDHSDSESVRRIKEELFVCPFETRFVALEPTGNHASLERVFELARERDNDLLYFAEDDYLHEPSALLEMVEAHKNFIRNTGSPSVALFPVDELDRYTENIEISRVVIGPNRHWRTTHYTTGTFLVPRTLFEAHLPLFLLLCEGQVDEMISVNRVWREHAIVFSPIPTLAYHMHTGERMPPFSNWKKLWDSLAV